jgi:arsenate reductase
MENPMTEKTYHVLFLCRHNSARSIMAECLMRRWGKNRFVAYSAGSHPAGEIHPQARALLEGYGMDTSGLRPKSWHEFADLGAPAMDFVFTVCEATARETCPTWPGGPMLAQWSVEDPAAATGSDAAVRRAFRHAFVVLEARIKLFTSLRVEALDRLALKRQLDEIGHEGETGS